MPYRKGRGAGPSHSEVAAFGSLLDILDDALRRRPDRSALALRGDDGVSWRWTYAELERRSRLAAWRIRRLGLRPGDRLVTWSPSTPELPAVYFGAMRAGVVLVPLDLRMAPEAVARILERAKPSWAALGSGRDAPDPRGSGLGDLPTTTIASLAADLPAGNEEQPFPANWEEIVAGWPRPGRDDVFEIIYTSGTTGTPKGVALTHGNVLSSIDAFGLVIPPLEHRLVSLLPLSHLMEQAVALFYATLVGADILYVRSRNPRVIFEAIRQHRVTSLLLVPQIMELFWAALTREIERQGRGTSFERARRVARHLPYAARRWIFGEIHRQFGGGLRLIVTAGAFLPPALQQAWEDLGGTVLQGYGATECGIVACQSPRDHAPGTVGRVPQPSPIVVELASDGEIVVSGPTVLGAYWEDPETTAAAFDGAGRYHTGDIGRLDERGNLVLLGRSRNVIVLPNGFNVFPEDIENALHVAGLADTVVIETDLGRIEAIVLPPAPLGLRGPGSAQPDRSPTPAEDAEIRRTIDAAVRQANSSLAVHQRVQGWRLWPEPDFPRTHTFKVRRDLVQARSGSQAPLPLVGDRP